MVNEHPWNSVDRHGGDFNWAEHCGEDDCVDLLGYEVEDVLSLGIRICAGVGGEECVAAGGIGVRNGVGELSDVRVGAVSAVGLKGLKERPYDRLPARTNALTNTRPWKPLRYPFVQGTGLRALLGTA